MTTSTCISPGPDPDSEPDPVPDPVPDPDLEADPAPDPVPDQRRYRCVCVCGGKGGGGGVPISVIVFCVNGSKEWCLAVLVLQHFFSVTRMVAMLYEIIQHKPYSIHLNISLLLWI